MPVGNYFNATLHHLCTCSLPELAVIVALKLLFPLSHLTFFNTSGFHV